MPSTPDFARCSDTTQGVNQAINHYAKSNNFTILPDWVECAALQPTYLRSEIVRIISWIIFFHLLILLFMLGKHLCDIEMRERERVEDLRRCDIEAQKTQRSPLIVKEIVMKEGTMMAKAQ